MPRGERSESLAPLGKERAGGPTEIALAPLAFRLEPHGVGELLDVALEVFRQRFFVFVGIAFVLEAGAQPVLQQLLRWSAAAREREAEALATVLEIGAGLSGVLVGLVILAATCRLAYAVCEGRPIPLRSVLATVLRRLLPLAVATAITVVIVFLGMFACIVPGIYFLVKAQLTTAVVVLERAGPLQALRRSFALTRGLFPFVLGTLVVGTLLFSPFESSAAVMQDPLLRREFLGMLGISTAGVVSEWSLTLLFTLLGAVSSAYVAVLGTLLYVETRVRREGFDLYVHLARARARVESQLETAVRPSPSGGAAAAWEGLA